MPSSHVLQFIGGLTFFFFGLFTLHQGLHSFAGDRLKNLIRKSTVGPIKSIVTGIVATFFLQSSTATSLMTIGLASSGLLTLRQAMAVLLGAGIGTTFVVLIISIKSIMQLGLVFFIGGFLMSHLGRRKVIKMWGEIILGFGLVFFGMTVMGEATAPLNDNPLVPQIFQFMREYPLLNFVIAAVLTAFINSSSAVVGILVSLAHAHAITFHDALPLVLGANVGTCFSSLIAASQAKTDGKRAAWANFLLRVSAVAMIFPVFKIYVNAMDFFINFVMINLFDISPDSAVSISFFHFLFNVQVVIVFLPLLSLGEKIMVWLIPVHDEAEQKFGPMYLDETALMTPSLAFAQVNREIVRMGEIIQKMFRQCHGLFQKYDLDRVDEIRGNDHQVDILYKATKFYMAKLPLTDLQEKEASLGMHLITAVNEFENIGDTIDGHFVRLAHKKASKAVKFSDEGWMEICEVQVKTTQMMDMALATLSSANREIALKMLTHSEHLQERQNELKMTHLKRLNAGLKESIETSAIHLELMALYHRISLALLTIVHHYLPEKEYLRMNTADGG
ncbi:Na/Pi cotransporter family protein [bacterium]|nr:Na/Pi cotransporter family protein [bacterium]